MLEFSCGYFTTFLLTKYGVPVAHCFTTVPQACARVPSDNTCSSTHGRTAYVFREGLLICKLHAKWLLQRAGFKS